MAEASLNLLEQLHSSCYRQGKDGSGKVHAVYRSVFGPELGDLEHVGIVDVVIWEVVDC